MSSGTHAYQVKHYFSQHLNRQVIVDIYPPPGYETEPERHYPLLLFNDGQDLPATRLVQTLDTLVREKTIPPVFVAGIHAGRGRRHEYGTLRQPDYKGRGEKAPNYRDFVLLELLPELRGNWRLSTQPEENLFAGFSLGGLSAFDMTWAHPEVFGAAGVFSGSLWWRWSAVDPANPDADRIMHDVVQTSPGPYPNQQRFWFQAGTLDEADDRNNNGIIDAIDDTLQLIEALKNRGFGNGQVQYLEIDGGTHDPATWGIAMPDFLRWAFSHHYT